ncbi:FAD-dependent oxidoreductase [Maribellus comscasis]|uniref:FAD-dependent oxidoreductase n=1 Tax=Maribellus comscasis TaxID=2681766 RepID=A0A6I6K1Q3_9BACT|nr:glycerol-3-phosphate dehydrogenase/oxidase [Maribellus comscasis]QGY47330.1 FAD-dependent oxidoreductase [Maribellus comscasis]
MKRTTRFIQDSHFDVLIIGGGITGAAVAYEAVTRGFSVALFEKDDFGGATSAATSKMIHGGLRYLAKMELKLVRESLRERRILTNIAPNFVHPAPYLLTGYKNGKTPGWMLKAAMILYDLLSFDKNWLRDKSKRMPKHRTVSKNNALSLEPSLISDGLLHSQIYYDCISFSPERLTLAFIKSAVEAGAKVLNYAEVKDFLFEKKSHKRKVYGCKVFDKVANNEYNVLGRYVINCSGPWADVIVNKASKKYATKVLRRSEGIHFITKKLVNNYIVTATTLNGRHCFIVPWRNRTLIGTTDKEFIGKPDEYKVAKSTVNDFLEEVNQVFGEKEKLQYSDVQFVYGGLRPLVEDQTKDVYESSRKYEIVDHEKDGISGLITVEGGKYTTSRSLAENLVDYLFKKVGKKPIASISASKFLKGSDIENFQRFVDVKTEENPEFKGEQIDFLCKMYGTELDSVLRLAKEDGLSISLNADGEIEAQVVYAIQNEMAIKLSDILFRRTGIGTLGHPGEETLAKVLNIAATLLNWDEKRKETELKEVEEILKIPEN